MPDFVLAAALAGAFVAVLAASGRLRFVVEELPTRGRRFAGLVLLWAVLATCVFLPIVSPGAAAEVDPETLWFPSLFAGQIVLAAFLYAWWWVAQPLSWRRFLFLEDGSAADLRFGVRIGALAWLLALTASGVITMILYGIGYEPTGGTGALAEPFEVPPVLLWLVELPVWRKLIVVAVAMTIEEGFYRAFLQTRLGWVSSSVLFALSHAGYGLPSLMASVFAVSLVIGWALRQRGNLVPCIIAHGVFDAVQLLVVMPLALDHLKTL